MKKIFLLLSVISVLHFSCNKSETETKQEGLPLNEMEILCIQDDLIKQLSEEEVINLLQDFSNEGSKTKSSSDLTFLVKKKSYQILDKKNYLKNSTHLKNSIAIKDSTEIYNVTIEGNNKTGFALVSADRRCPNVLCYIPDGSIEDTIENKGAAFMLKNSEDKFYRSIIEYKNIIDSLKDITIAKVCEFEGISRDEYYAGNYAEKHISDFNRSSLKFGEIFNPNFTYSPVLQTTWHQNAPYNLSCPDKSCLETTNNKCLAGCVAIAVGQIAFHYRASPPHTNPNSSAYNYDQIQTYINVPDGPSQAAKDVGVMIYNIATNARTNFGCTESSAGSDAAINFLNQFYTSQGNKFNGKNMRDTFPLLGPVLLFVLEPVQLEDMLG